jgi:hypothetical protein
MPENQIDETRANKNKTATSRTQAKNNQQEPEAYTTMYLF